MGYPIEWWRYLLAVYESPTPDTLEKIPPDVRATLIEDNAIRRAWVDERKGGPLGKHVKYKLAKLSTRQKVLACGIHPNERARRNPEAIMIPGWTDLALGSDTLKAMFPRGAILDPHLGLLTRYRKAEAALTEQIRQLEPDRQKALEHWFDLPRKRLYAIDYQSHELGHPGLVSMSTKAGDWVRAVYAPYYDYLCVRFVNCKFWVTSNTTAPRIVVTYTSHVGAILNVFDDPNWRRPTPELIKERAHG